MRRCALFFGALVLLLAQLGARADERLDRAKATAERARSFAASGAYEDAAKAYAEAFRLVPNAVVKYNEAESWYAAGQAAPAADAYEHALKMETLDAERTTRSKKLLLELERKLGVLVIEGGGTISVAHVRGLRSPARIHLPPGTHTVVVESGADRHERSVTIVAGRTSPLVLPDAPPPKPAPVRPRPRASEREEGVSTQRIIGFTGLGLGAAAGIASAIVGGIFLSELDAFEDGGRTDAELRDRTLTLQVWTSGTAIAGAVFTAVGVLLVLTAPNGAEDAARILSRGGISF
ncbi:MAG TPA: hypothetical protein VFB62_14630 [Polyangiaceae bacterium]|jgi:hypothetical protein|nr:hypothetical protein [Polyangiaceae bacterium]